MFLPDQFSVIISFYWSCSPPPCHYSCFQLWYWFFIYFCLLPMFRFPFHPPASCYTLFYLTLSVFFLGLFCFFTCKFLVFMFWLHFSIFTSFWAPYLPNHLFAIYPWVFCLYWSVFLSPFSTPPPFPRFLRKIHLAYFTEKRDKYGHLLGFVPHTYDCLFDPFTNICTSFRNNLLY